MALKATGWAAEAAKGAASDTFPCQSPIFWAPAGSSGAMRMSGVGVGVGETGSLPWLLGSEG